MQSGRFQLRVGGPFAIGKFQAPTCFSLGFFVISPPLLRAGRVNCKAQTSDRPMSIFCILTAKETASSAFTKNFNWIGQCVYSDHPFQWISGLPGTDGLGDLHSPMHLLG